MTKLLRLLVLILAAPAVSFASSDDVGTSGAQFLKLGAGARAAAMGEAYCAVADGGEAVYWNPAALTRVEASAISFMHGSVLGELNYEYLGYARRLGRRTAFGAAFQYLSAGSISETDEAGYNTGGTMSPKDLAVSVAFARRFRKFGIGATAKYISSTLTKTATAFAFDFGIRAPRIFSEKLTLAFVAQNLGSSIKFDQASDPLPRNFKLGAAYSVSEKITAAADINLPRDNGMYLALGAETRMTIKEHEFAARAGYNTRGSGDVGGLAGFAMGLGGKFGDFQVDYAFSPFGDLGSNHRVSLAMAFGKPHIKEEKAKSEEPAVPVSAPMFEVAPSSAATAVEVSTAPVQPEPQPEIKKAKKKTQEQEPEMFRNRRPDTDTTTTPALPSYDKKLLKY